MYPALITTAAAPLLLRVPDAVQREVKRSGAPLIRDPGCFRRVTKKPGSRVCSASFRYASCCAAPGTPTVLNPLERERNALADADAHGGERELAAAPLEAMHGGEREPRARHAERMSERDRAAVGIDVLGVVGDAELAQTGER